MSRYPGLQPYHHSLWLTFQLHSQRLKWKFKRIEVWEIGASLLVIRFAFSLGDLEITFLNTFLPALLERDFRDRLSNNWKGVSSTQKVLHSDLDGKKEIAFKHWYKTCWNERWLLTLQSFRSKMFIYVLWRNPPHVVTFGVSIFLISMKYKLMTAVILFTNNLGQDTL